MMRKLSQGRRDRLRVVWMPGLAAGAVLGLTLTVARAEQLPLTSFTTSQGLSHNRVNDIFRCSRGYLWFSTPGGVSRFDGHAFVNYGRDEGLESQGARAMIQTADGHYWVACGTPEVYRLDPEETEPGRIFRRVRLEPESADNRVETLMQDRAGRLWAGTNQGLFISQYSDDRASFRRVNLTTAGLESSAYAIAALLEDRQGTLWIGGGPGLSRLSPDGGVTRVPLTPGALDGGVFSLIEDHSGRIWVGHTGGLTILMPWPSSDGGETRFLPSGTGAPQGRVTLPAAPGEAFWTASPAGRGVAAVYDVHQTGDGHVWLVTHSDLLVEFADGEFRIHDANEGLNEHLVALGEDPAGNLWVGSNSRGAQRVSRGGFTAFGRADGLGYLGHGVLIRSRSQGVLVNADDRLYHLEESGIQPIAPRIPALGPISLGRIQARVLEDREGRWWLAAGGAVYRFPAQRELKDLERVHPALVYGSQVAPSADFVAALFEDARGDIWIGLGGSHPVARCESGTGLCRRYGEAEGLPAGRTALSFAQDLKGNLWVGLRGGVARLRGDRFESFAAAQGRPQGEATTVYVDAPGRLWIARTGGGAVRVDDPTAEQPVFRVYTTREGLASDAVTCFTEDRWGRIYIGGISGIDRLDPDSGRIRRYSIADGLSNDEITSAQSDRDGALWFTSRLGVSRLVPQADAQAGVPPQVRIAGLTIAGARYPVSPLGEQRIDGINVSHTQNRLQVDFGAIAFTPGRAPRYQFVLEGSGADWSPAADVPGVQLAGLAPGSYRMLVRAVDGEGRASAAPASVSFLVLPPFWSTWWFVSLVALVLVSALSAIHRRRVARAVQIERVRTRIATDLHDDVGSSLTQIAILSEVALRDVSTRREIGHERLERIAGISRTLVDSMSDIVWSINPAADRIADLLYRMRRFASDVFAAGSVQFRLTVPEAGIEETLDAEVRRQAYLVFKESVNNAVRHSGCTRVEIRLALEKDRLILSVRDNGSGFDPVAGGEGRGGHGLDSMRARAERLGGRFQVESRPGKGTSVTLALPLKGPRASGGRAGFGRPPTNTGGAGRPGQV